MNNKSIILLKAIGKTILSILNTLIKIIIIIGLIVGVIYIFENPVTSIMAQTILIFILLIIFLIVSLWSVVFLIKDSIKVNYERYARKSVKTKNTYRINYKIIFKDNIIVKGKTKEQAKENLYKILREKNTENVDSDCKITKIKEII